MSSKVTVFCSALVAIMVVLISSVMVQHQVSAGNKGNNKGRDIILYNNNLLIRGEKKGKGGNLLIAEDKGHHHHGHHGHHGYEMEHHGGHYGEHHGGHEHKMMGEILMNDKKGKGKGRNMKTGQKKNDVSWEQFLMSGSKGMMK